MSNHVRLLLVVPLLAACSTTAGYAPTPEDATPSRLDSRSLTAEEVTAATSVVHDEVVSLDATITSATAIGRAGVIEHGNTGHPCTSGRELLIQLIGRFPRTVTTGHPVEPGEPMPDVTVRGLIITADAGSGRPCLIGAQTAEEEPERLLNATRLPVDGS